jgi:catechol 2,3-dioxygenase-like lactoylglutathione lyase family enzyme
VSERRPTIDEIRVGDEPDAWRAAGFAVDDDGTCRIGTVRLALVGTDEGRGLLGWALRDVAATGPIDGLPTSVGVHPPAEPAVHACGVTQIDHVVVMTPDGARTAAAFTAATGLEVRRVRDTDASGSSLRQRFFRLGEVILEVVSPEPATEGQAAQGSPADGGPAAGGPVAGGTPAGGPAAGGLVAQGPAAFFGLGLVVADLDAQPARYGEALGPIRNAVQPGRRVATLRHRRLHLSVPTLLMTPDR